jgi:hypothetical protein
MNVNHIQARLAALIVGGALLVSCDTRHAPGGIGGPAGPALGATVKIVTPTLGSMINVTDSTLTLSVRLTDLDHGLKNVVIKAVSIRGSAQLGTQTVVTRYASVMAPATGNFFPGPGGNDTLVTRLLAVITPIDTTVRDSLTLIATATNMLNQVTADTVTVRLVNGPSVKFLQPTVDSVFRGQNVTVTLEATSTFIGIDSIGFTVTSNSVPPNALNLAFGQSVPNRPPRWPFSAAFVVRDSAKPGDIITITPVSRDANRQAGSSVALHLRVVGGLAPPPLVYQTIAPRVELFDSVTIAVTGSLIRQVGFEVQDSTGATVGGDSVAVTNATPNPYRLSLKLATSLQGKALTIISFAQDSTGRRGWSLPAGGAISQSVKSLAFKTPFLVVFGRTYALPLSRAGIASDLTVDQTRGFVYMSNTQYNRLERWNGVTTSFDPSGVAVGSLPWGMAIQTDGDTLLVANSGGTNISKVCIGCAVVSEVLAQRLQTRNTFVHTVSETRDPATGRIRLVVSAPISYSDRPQYVQQSAGGRVFYSTRPTATAPAGTIRWLDPKLAVPDPRQVYQYAEKTIGTTYAVFNADSIYLVAAPAASLASDQLIIFDHIYGTKVGGSCTSPQTNGTIATVANTICGRDSVVMAAVGKVNAQGGDVDARLDIDVTKLGLTDTTFVAASGDRSWIGFGEGATGGTGRVMLVQDTAKGPQPGYFSPAVTVVDLLNNASERVFGLGLDKYGSTVAVHGSLSYFAFVEAPFHLRLQGSYNSFSSGAGITFHPSADLRNGFFTSSLTDSTRTAYVASANGSIQIVDAKFYVGRGAMQTRDNFYGPLRASLPFISDNPGVAPTDPRYVVLKLFGLTTRGLVVIDVRAQDIKPVP